MIAKRRVMLAACALMVLGVSTANAGPCNPRDKDDGFRSDARLHAGRRGTGLSDIKQQTQ
jgi:hypothetical protein